MSVIIAEEIERLTSRLDAIIREQAGEVLFEHLNRIRQLAAAARQHHDRVSVRRPTVAELAPPADLSSATASADLRDNPPNMQQPATPCHIQE